jgi:hypothetical protein
VKVERERDQREQESRLTQRARRSERQRNGDRKVFLQDETGANKPDKEEAQKGGTRQRNRERERERERERRKERERQGTYR